MGTPVSACLIALFSVDQLSLHPSARARKPAPFRSSVTSTIGQDSQMRELCGRAALITGASSDVGSRIAQHLAARGLRLVLSGRDDRRLQATKALVDARGAQAHSVVTDLSDEAAVVALADRAQAHLGEIDVVVHAAARAQTSDFASIEVADARALLWLNVGSPLLLTQRLLPGMLRRRRGHVVAVGSMSALLGGAYQVHYAASKAALDAAMRGLRAEYRRTGVGFSVVHPGPIRDSDSYTAIADNHGRVPRLVGETSLDRVAAAVVRAIENHRPQSIVMGHTPRPLLALQSVAPRYAEVLVQASGISRYFARVASSTRP